MMERRGEGVRRGVFWLWMGDGRLFGCRGRRRRRREGSRVGMEMGRERERRGAVDGEDG